MDPLDNPYTPNAGATPPVLVGRKNQLEAFELLIQRLARGYNEQSMIVTGLRGVGKTVLLNSFRERAESMNWIVVEFEASKHEDKDFRIELTQKFRQALLHLAPSTSWRDKAKQAAAAIKGFSLSVDPTGSLTMGMNVDGREGLADSGMLAFDLTDLIVAVGEAAKEHEKGVLILIDEVQFLSKPQLEALITAIHKTVQRAVPITMVGAGLPQIAELAGEAKSYAERLFTFPKIGSLSRDDADQAIVEPAEEAGLQFDDDALEEAFKATGGYPYFIQELGSAVWPLADVPSVTKKDILAAHVAYEEKLDSSFFRVRLDRATELESAYLRAMAELGPEPQSAASVADLLGRTSQQCGPTRSGLVQKGLLFTPSHGYAAFTVPHFDRFMKRAIPILHVPPVQVRTRPSI